MICCRAILLAALMLPVAAAAERTLTIAVASNFQPTASEIARRFEDATGIDVRLSVGSTGKLYAQIVNGAPYDIFLAADLRRPELLIDSGLALPDSLLVYATGSLVLWSASAMPDENCDAMLRQNAFRHLAIANPDTAPYGAAAREYLQNEGLWEQVREKLVFGENIGQTFQFVATGNATLGLVAAAQLAGAAADASGCMAPIAAPANTPATLRQAMVILGRSRMQDAASRFAAFIRSDDIRALIRDRGYSAPAGQSGA